MNQGFRWLVEVDFIHAEYRTAVIVYALFCTICIFVSKSKPRYCVELTNYGENDILKLEGKQLLQHNDTTN